MRRKAALGVWPVHGGVGTEPGLHAKQAATNDLPNNKQLADPVSVRDWQVLDAHAAAITFAITAAAVVQRESSHCIQQKSRHACMVMAACQQEQDRAWRMTCGGIMGCAVHYVAHDLGGHDHNIALCIQGAIARLQPHTLCAKQAPEFIELLVAQGLERGCVDDSLSPAIPQCLFA